MEDMKRPADKNRTTVIVGGKEYTLKSSDSPEHLHRVALFVDRQLEAMGRDMYSVSPLTGMVLVSLNISDELLKTRDAIAELRQQYDAQQELISQQRERLAELQARVLRLQRELETDPESGENNPPRRSPKFR